MCDVLADFWRQNNKMSSICFQKNIPYTIVFLTTKIIHFFTNIIWMLFLYIFSIKNTLLYTPHILVFGFVS